VTKSPDYTVVECDICGKEFVAPYEGMRKSSNGKLWCKKDQDDFDSIDWDEIAEKRMEEGF
jgi:hypothetical protein